MAVSFEVWQAVSYVLGAWLIEIAVVIALLLRRYWWPRKEVSHDT